MHFFKKIKIDFFMVFLILIAIFLCYQNYTPNTFLSGWDTLHPEFNFKLYLQRISNVWQSHQGLGAPPSQAHLAELPRMIIIGILLLIFPLNFIRYAYFFLMIIIGPLGIYLLIKYLFYDFLDDRFKSRDANVPVIHNIAAFLGALFYLLNLGTVQHFIAPLEMFATKFGFLGFLYLYALKFINEGKKKNLIIFAIFTIFASPMAHTATLWYVYFLGLLLFLTTYVILNKSAWKKALILASLTILLNLYWILPNVYYSINYSKDVISSKIHRLSTEDTFYYNKKYGNISDFLLLKNFLFDWRITNNQVKPEYLLSAWQTHLNNPYIIIFAYSLTFFAAIGLILAFYKKNKILISFIPISLISGLFLLSGSTFVSFFLDRLINLNDFIREVFRSPFTKFSIYLIFTFSIFFAYFHKIVLEKITLKFIIWFYFYTILFIVFTYSLPAFQGNFISKIVRVRIPQEYFSLFEWSKNNDNGRILTLPAHNLFGWVYYQWDLPEETQIYQGAGFNWFGLKQPTLNREFDRWYSYNEQAYREFSYAIYSNNVVLLEKLLEKYQIKYILLDENIIIPGDPNQDKKLYYNQLEKLLAESSKLALTNTFAEKIRVYLFLSNSNYSDSTLKTNLKNVLPIYKWNYIDQAYLENGEYISDAKNGGEIFYPATNILTNKERLDENSYALILNQISAQNQSNINIKDLDSSLADCSFEKSEFIDKKLVSIGSTEYLEYQAKNGTVCDNISFSDLNHEIAYLLAIESQNTSGLPLRLCFENNTTKKCVLEDELSKNKTFGNDYFIIPPYFDGLGYHLILNNYSIGNISTINRLKTIKIIPLQYDLLQTIRWPANTSAKQKNYVLISNQAYEKNWKAWIDGKELKEHVLVNNWANGWKINRETCNVERGTCQINIIFWPQYLEFLGFGLMLLGLIYILKYKS